MRNLVQCFLKIQIYLTSTGFPSSIIEKQSFSVVNSCLMQDLPVVSPCWWLGINSLIFNCLLKASRIKLSPWPVTHSLSFLLPHRLVYINQPSWLPIPGPAHEDVLWEGIERQRLWVNVLSDSEPNQTITLPYTLTSKCKPNTLPIYF